MKENCVNVALPKGRLAEDTIELFLKKGITNEGGVVDFNSRRLTFYDEINNINFMLVRNMDVSTYVEHGAADIGVVGKDNLIEAQSDVYEYLDLGFGYCRLCVAGVKESDLSYRHDMIVATKYPAMTKNFFAKKGGSLLRL